MDGLMIDAPPQPGFASWHTPAVPDPREPTAPPQGFTGDVLTPAFRQFNAVGSMYDVGSRAAGFAIDPSYDATTDKDIVSPDSKYFPSLGSFVGTRSKQETQAIMARIDRTQQDRDNIARSGWRGYVAALIAGALDPVNAVAALSGFGDEVAATRIGSAVIKAGEGAVSTGLAAGTQQTILQGLDPTHTTSESLWNTLVAASLGGILGGGGSLLSRPEVESIRSGLSGRSNTAVDAATAADTVVHNPLDIVGYNARLAESGVPAVDRPDFLSAYSRVMNDFHANAAELEAIRLEAGQPRTAPEIVAETTRLAGIRDRDLAELDSILRDYSKTGTAASGHAPVEQSAGPAIVPVSAEIARPKAGEPLVAPMPIVTEAPGLARAASEQAAPAAETAGAPRAASKIGKSIEQKAVDARLTNGFADTAGYDTVTIKDQAERATKVVNDDIEHARSIVRGEEELPQGLHGISLISAMEEHLRKNPSAEVAYELANSPLVSQTSAAAQVLRLAAERAPDSVAAKFQAIRDARLAAAERRGGVKAATKKVTDDIKANVAAAASKRPTWEAFVKSIEC